MHYNFIKKSKIQEISSSTGVPSSYNLFEPIKSFNINKKILKYTKTITSSDDILWYQAFNLINNPYKNYIDALYPNIFDWNSFSSMAVVAVNHGDKLCFQSTIFNYDSKTLNDYLTTTANERYPNYYEKIGYLRDSSTNSHKGYVLYEHGIYVLFDDASSALDLWSSGDSFTYSCNLDQQEIKIYCEIDGQRTKSSGNLSYWTKINESDSSTTSSLTSYWSQLNLPNLSISANAKDWLIIEENEKPLFVTKIGLYNEKKECLAVAAIKEPFKLLENFDMTFAISLKF